MMHYSGDTDGAVAPYGTKRWIKKLDWEVTAPWAPWMYDSQVEVKKNYKWNCFQRDSFGPFTTDRSTS